MSRKPATLAKARKAAGLGAQGAGGRPPRYAYDPTTLHGQRDAARGKAGDGIADCVELWTLMVQAGVSVLRALRDGTATQGESVSVAGALAGKVTTVTRDGDGDGWTNETRTEAHPYAGLDWGAVNRAAENLADRAGLARKTETELTGELPQKLWSLGTYRDKDGDHHELPRDPSGDPPPA